jgi:hypothetical protein
MTRGGRPAYKLGTRLTTPHCKKQFVMKYYTGPENWMDSCEHGNEPSGSIKGRQFLDKLSDS